MPIAGFTMADPPWGGPRQPTKAAGEVATVVLAPFAVTLVMAMLVVQPRQTLNTLSNRVLRLGWLVVAWAVHLAIGFHWRFPIPGLDPMTGVGKGTAFGAAIAWHFGAGVLLIVNALRMLGWAFATKAPGPYDLLLEQRNSATSKHVSASASASTRDEQHDGAQVNGGNKVQTTVPSEAQLSPLQPLLPLPMDLVINLHLYERGPGLQRQCQLHGQDSTRARHIFIVHRIALFICTWIALDTLESISRNPDIFPPIAQMVAAPLSAARQGILGQWGPVFVAACFVLEINWSLTLGFSAASAGYAMIWSNPDLGPWEHVPAVQVLSATSLRSLWSEHWHQLLRSVLVDIGGQPCAKVVRTLTGNKIFSSMAFVFGSFALSGIIHEVGQSYMSTHSLMDHPPGAALKFFVLQGVGMAIEQTIKRTPTFRSFRNWTPSVIGSVVGWLYTYTFLAWSGMDMVNTWFLYGCSAAAVTPRSMTVLTSRFLAVLPLPGPVS